MTGRGWLLIGGAAVVLLAINRQGVIDIMSGWQQKTEFDEQFAFAEQYNDMPPGLLKRMAWQESRYNPAAKSPVGAFGLLQFMPATWAEWGGGFDIADPVAQIRAAGLYLKWLYQRLGSWDLALAAYNWGIGNVQRKGIDAAPRETKNYVAQIGADVPGVLA